MAVCEILRMGHPVLGRVAREVSNIELQSLWLSDLIGDMDDTLEAAGGIGLAAPQIGVSVRLAIIRFAGGPSRYGMLPNIPLTVYINPEIRILNGAMQGFWEGCLSIPGLRGYVRRPKEIAIDYLDTNGEAQSIGYEGFLATVFQHEFDHLDGILYPQRMDDLKKLVFEQEYQKFLADQPDYVKSG